MPDEDIRSTVSGGIVTLEGQVYTLRKKEDAARAIRTVPGVKEVTNWLTVPSVKADPEKLRESIEEALQRRAEREAEKIQVTVGDGVVTLAGRLRTWPQKTAVRGVVSHAPGVREVRDPLVVRPWD